MLHDSTGKEKFYLVWYPLKITLPDERGGVLRFRLWNDFHPSYTSIVNKLTTPFSLIENATVPSDLKGHYKEYPGSYGPAGGKEVSLNLPSGTRLLTFYATGSQAGVEISHIRFEPASTVSADRQQPGSARTRAASTPFAPACRHAVVIGISDYKHRGKWNLTNLRYAARDAQALAGWLGDSQGGRFDQVEVLTDADATTRNVKIALREKLRGAQRDDLVLIFWAGHGSPDPHDMGRLYLVTHDSDPEHMAGTAYSMKEFQEDIASLGSERVVVIADACHSAGVSDPTLAMRGPEENRIVTGFRGITVAPTAVADAPSVTRLIFTSSEAGELSAESSELGGGHGVFTYYLLDALRGAADHVRNNGNGDGSVTLGELVEYTRDAVRRATGNQQHPDTAGRFDRNLVMTNAEKR